MQAPLAKTLSGFALLFATACGAIRNGDFADGIPDSIEGGPATPFGFAPWQGREVRRWVRLSAQPDITIWQNLTASLDKVVPAHALEGRGSAMIAMDSLKGLPQFVFVTARADTRLSPVGPAGASVALTAGPHVLYRWCTADQPNNFQEIALWDQTLYDTRATDAVYGVDPYVAACNLLYEPKLDLGEKVAALPASSGGMPLPVADLAWAPTSDALFLLAGTLVSHDVELLRYSAGAATLERSPKGDYDVPLAVASDSRVLVNQVSWSGDYSTDSIAYWVRRFSVSWQAGQVSAAVLPVSEFPAAGTQPLDVISPDGTMLASRRSDGRIDLIDLSRNTILPTSPRFGLPLAWDPSGQKLLARGDGEILWLGQDGSQERVTSISVSGRFQPAQGQQDRVFAGVSGPKLLRQDDYGTRLVDLLTGASVLFVEPDRVAAPGAMLGLAVTTEQVFAWAVQCLGLAETACTTELRRLTIATGMVDVVARADGPLPFAVSPDGRQLALAHGEGLYIKTLTP